MELSNPTLQHRSRVFVGAAVLAAAALLTVGSVPTSGQKSDNPNQGYPQQYEKAQKGGGKKAKNQPPFEQPSAPPQGANAGRRVSVNDVRRIARANGYNQGFDHGTVDRKKGSRSGYANGREYQKGVTGYHGDFQSVNDYRNSYRAGYAAGYQDAQYRRNRNLVYDYRRIYQAYPWYRNVYYDGNPYYQYDDPGRWDPNDYNDGGYGNFAYDDDHHGNLNPQEVARRAAQRGYYAGYERGQYDAARDRGRPNPNPQGHGAYQFGLDGWVREWGSGATYQHYYREYFILGYEDAYRQRGRAFHYREL